MIWVVEIIETYFSLQLWRKNLWPTYQDQSVKPGFSIPIPWLPVLTCCISVFTPCVAKLPIMKMPININQILLWKFSWCKQDVDFSLYIQTEIYSSLDSLHKRGYKHFCLPFLCSNCRYNLTMLSVPLLFSCRLTCMNYDLGY